jgi:hypothetical protein
MRRLDLKMSMRGGLPAFGDRVTLTCSCEAEIVVPLIMFLPRHCVVRIVGRSSNCRAPEHTMGRRLVVRWSHDRGRRVFGDVLGE